MDFFLLRWLWPDIELPPFITIFRSRRTACGGQNLGSYYPNFPLLRLDVNRSIIK